MCCSLTGCGEEERSDGGRAAGGFLEPPPPQEGEGSNSTAGENSTNWTWYNSSWNLTEHLNGTNGSNVPNPGFGTEGSGNGSDAGEGVEQKTSTSLPVSSTPQAPDVVTTTQLDARVSTTQLDARVSTTQLDARVSTTQLDARVSTTQLDARGSTTQLDVEGDTENTSSIDDEFFFEESDNFTDDNGSLIEEYANSPPAPSPGAPWTELEMRAIKETLWRKFGGNRNDWEDESCVVLGDDEYPCALERLEPNVLESCHSPNASVSAELIKLSCSSGADKWMTDGAIPSVPKFLRMGFHDCFKYEDGSGGCDGCLNLDGAFVVKNMDEAAPPDATRAKARFPYDFLTSSNTNLAMTADVLDKIYRDVNYGYQSNYLTQSLFETGKSRADLWAFAAQVSVEYLMERNNYFCGHTSDDNKHIHPYGEPTLGLPHDCAIRASRYMEFKSGRRDCAESYKPPQPQRTRDYEVFVKEVTPNPHANGLETIQFMRDYFGFTARETVAIMGAHSAGTFHSTNSGFRYTWMGMELGQERAMNNLYYRVMAYRPIYLQDDLQKIQEYKAAGEYVPGPSNITLEMRPRNLCPGKGPVQWFMRTVREPGTEMKHGPTHVSFLNCDIGFYFDFDTYEGGGPIRPASGRCTPLPEGTSTKNERYITEEQAHHDCLQLDDAGEGTPLYQIVEEYADDQNLWWDDFVVAMEKMLEIGYGEGELTPNGVIHVTTTTTTRPPVPPLEDCNKDFCCQGVKSSAEVCCAWECGKCGGNGCHELPGGRDRCCLNAIRSEGRICANASDTVCLIPE